MYQREIKMNKILGRDAIADEIRSILYDFDTQYKNVNFKKGIYVYGAPGCGKTEFVTNILKEMNYDIIKYDAGDVRNKALIEVITSNHISTRNVLHMMSKKEKKIAIVMDEIDGMNNGDKGGITSLIKLIRQKKTKKQKTEDITVNPIICIGNYYIDKKIKELMRVCNAFELKTPTQIQVSNLLKEYVPSLENNINLKLKSMRFIQGDIRKLLFIKNINDKKPEILNSNLIENVFHIKHYNEDAKKITQTLINYPISMGDHANIMNETDRTIVALLYHENIIDPLKMMPITRIIPFYLKVLNNICFADYIDRITFQNQIWIFNEMSSLIKTFYNNKLYHDEFPENKNKFHPHEVRFTKILTKYSTEYNNQIFIYNLCQKLSTDKKDLVAFFQELRIVYGAEFYNNAELLAHVEKSLDTYEINKLDIKRMYRYLDKNVKKDAVVFEDDITDD
jgi:hypothetical protein